MQTEETTLQELENEPEEPVIEQGEVAEEGTESEPQEEPKESKPKENRYSKRVKGLNTQLREEQRARIALEERLKKFEEANKLTEEPNPDTYEDPDKYRKDRNTWNEQEREKIRQEERENLKRENAQKAYKKKIDEGVEAYKTNRVEYAKNDEKFRSYEIEIDDIVEEYQTPDIQDFILGSKETGPAIVKYLGTNPDELLEIASASPQQRAFKMGRLVSKLEAKPVKKSSSAPPPPRSEGASAPKTNSPAKSSRHTVIKGETFAQRAKRLNGR